MSFVLETVAIVVAFFFAMLGLQAWGTWLGERHRRLDTAGDKQGYRATEGAVFAMLGLFLAFTFSGAGARFDARRHLIVEEANAIGTAWLRIDLLPSDRQPEVRALFREYLDSRLQIYRLVAHGVAPDAALAKSLSLQKRIWSASVSAAIAADKTPPFTVLLPALNHMIDITTTRTMATTFHPPVAIYGMIGILALVSSVFVGYGMAGQRVRSLVHTVGFAAAMSAVLYVILDLDYPRVGLIRVDATDQVLVDLRASMN